jgi:predicted tellurium resistance membrane protein TerC
LLRLNFLRKILAHKTATFHTPNVAIHCGKRLKRENMIKRNISPILIIIAMILIILNFDFSNFNIQSKKTWLFLGASIIIIATIILIFINENKNNKKSNF